MELNKLGLNKRGINQPEIIRAAYTHAKPTSFVELL